MNYLVQILVLLKLLNDNYELFNYYLIIFLKLKYIIFYNESYEYNVFHINNIINIYIV